MRTALLLAVLLPGMSGVAASDDVRLTNRYERETRRDQAMQRRRERNAAQRARAVSAAMRRAGARKYRMATRVRYPVLGPLAASSLSQIARMTIVNSHHTIGCTSRRLSIP